MNKIVSFEGIGYMAATFPVSEAAKTALEKDHLNPKTGNVDVNGKKLAVKLNEDGTVGFGTGTATDILLGILIAYEMDGFASVQLKGGVDEVPTAAELAAGNKGLVVNAKGEIVANESGRKTDVVAPSKADSLFASIVL